MTTEKQEDHDTVEPQERADERESGQGLAEYALILGLVSVAAVGALAAFQGGLSDLLGWSMFDSI